MRKKLMIVPALLMLAMFFAGCTKILEVEPQSNITEEIFFQNESDFEPNLAGIYTVARSLANNVTYGMERGEELISASNSRFTVAWSHNLSEASGAINYSEWYRGIGHCNLLLLKIQDFAFSSNPDLKKKILGETHALRAYFYFHLLRVIGDAPLMLQAVVDENVPLLPRSPASEVMKQIKADLDEAITQFSSVSQFSKNSYPSKYRFAYGSAQAIKADACLWSAKVQGGGQADYEAAITALNEVMQTGLSLNADFKNVTGTRASSNNEVLLAAYYHRDETPGGNYSKNALAFLSLVQGATNIDQIPYAVSSGNGQGAYQISPLSKSLFTNAADKRIPYTWVLEIQPTGPKISWITKYPGTKYSDDRIPDNDVIIYRLADILLMRAEAYAGVNDLANAKADLDAVRMRAGTGEYTGAMDKQTVESEILDERGRELYFENKRWFDLVRFHFGSTINIYEYVPNLKDKTTPLFWPLNATVFANNPNITQTEGY
ncbi:RagB/SusD family nutrient uptake outer membrane protein [Flavihumibacter solisilvae]|uniref:Carbohydrate-binding protein SusD n=1 Tax=Flavihumibacter solisilvae TaxID=1349421 RepID=A0A0C1IFW7_9BACT|nr:RagB/SusD family nutrient uptake outer membrane protein [Flavihumibacter solisilvae]KIC93025.1 carbohydrate-binding protein SusD [Flavihumibacter solisilvae]